MRHLTCQDAASEAERGGLYRKRPLPVRAVQMREAFEVDTLEGQRICGKAGDWLVGPGAKGEYWPVDAEVFAATYEPA